MKAVERKLQLRQHGMLWSVAGGTSLKRSVLELSKLYSRALRSHPKVVGLATPEEAVELFPACNRSVLLKTQERDHLASLAGLQAAKFSLADTHVWERLV